MALSWYLERSTHSALVKSYLGAMEVISVSAPWIRGMWAARIHVACSRSSCR